MRILIEQKISGLENWFKQLQTQVSELKPNNEELQEKLMFLQDSLKKALADQTRYQAQQIRCQKQIALLCSQIDAASDSKSIQPLVEKFKLTKVIWS